MRIDLYLSKNGFADSRQKAKGLLEKELVKLNGKIVTKSSLEVYDGDTVEVTGTALAYVGRGGLKLEGALNFFDIDPRDLVCADIGASTGGFTDCLLQNGAGKVYAVDAGHGQLHEKLQMDPRVINMENCNAKALDRTLIPEPIDLAVMDLSFISQTLIYPALTRILHNDSVLISLIKPQFEAGRSAIGKNGIVKDKKIHMHVIENILETAKGFHLHCMALAPSPITGGDGNIEYLAKFVFTDVCEEIDTISKDHIHRIVFGDTK